MNVFYNITKNMKDTLVAKGFRVVTMGDTYKVDIARQTIMPYAHIIPETSVHLGQTTEWNFTIIGMDIVDINELALRDQEEPFFMTDNMQDVLNDIHNRMISFCEYYRRGEGSELLFKMETLPSLEAFMDRYENVLTGWSMAITIVTPTDITIC